MSTYRSVAVGDRDVFYREAGDPADPTLLLLHGFPSSSAQYQQLMDLVSHRLHTVAPDLPGFGRSAALDGDSTFDGMAEVIERFVDVIELERFSLYMFDFGAPVGLRLASRQPDRVEGLVLQNGNAYEAGLGPGMQALAPYWNDRAGNEDGVRGFLQLDATRAQYVDGVPDPESVNPDLWELDQRYLDMAGRDQVMLDLLYDYQSNVAAYPAWQEYLRRHQPPALLPWGENDSFFPPAGAEAYLADLPDANIHLLDTGHFATATHSAEIAALVLAFLGSEAAE